MNDGLDAFDVIGDSVELPDMGGLVADDASYNMLDGNQDILDLLKYNESPGGFELDDLHADGGGVAEEMENILDSLGFEMDDIHLPWDSVSEDDVQAGVVGSPDSDAQFWQPQTTAFTCAVQAQRGIIEAFTGEEVSEAQLVYDATANGWLTEGGMSPYDVGNLLELHGIPCHAETGATVEELIAELAQGHKVIVGVDSGELWQNDSPLDDFFDENADHAIWVTGVDLSDPSNPKVIINDSGNTNDGGGKAYDLNLFEDAWKDSGFFYVSTDEAPEQVGMFAASGFDAEKGHFSALADWIAEKGSTVWDHLNSDEGRQEVRDATTTVAGIAGLVVAADRLFDASGDLLSANGEDAVFNII